MNGLFIPDVILNLPGISTDEKLILARVYQFEKNSSTFYMGNLKIAEMLGRSERNTQDKISSLVTAGHLIRKSFDGRKRQLALSPQIWKAIQAGQGSNKKQTSHAEIAKEDNKTNVNNLNSFYKR